MRVLFFTYFAVIFTFTAFSQTAPVYDQSKDGFLVFHAIKTDASGKIVPWNHAQPALAYDEIVNLTWSFWDTMRKDYNGLPYYMNHQVWRPKVNDPRGLGGDQLSMALSSFQLLYMYTGNERVKENMKFIADYYISHGFSSEDDAWANLPYPYNCFVYSGLYDGDMILGKGFTQPDKAGSFGWELLKLYKMCKQHRYSHANEELYLDYCIKIANTLAQKIKVGDAENSPLPFKVHAKTGEVGILKSNEGSGETDMHSGYTTNWSATLLLWEHLIKMQVGDTTLYKKAHQTMLQWMKNYPLKNQRWGPFFEDIPGWSDTQINAITFAQYIMTHLELFPDWKREVQNIFDWVYSKLGNKSWEKYGVLAINEQTVYQTPGNSHTARQGCAELQYASLVNDPLIASEAIRKLNWATYMVDSDGKNCYPRDEVWLTDGYGDYIRHYLRAMAYAPQLCPVNKNHIIYSSDIIAQVDYAPDINKKNAHYITPEEAKSIKIYYYTYQSKSVEHIRMAQKPQKITIDSKPIPNNPQLSLNSWTWTPMSEGGLLQINKDGYEVKIF